MRFFCIRRFWNETNSLSNPKDMSINREGFSSQAEKKETVKSFWTDPFQGANRFLNFL
jgi:hypothetical protein